MKRRLLSAVVLAMLVAGAGVPRMRAQAAAPATAAVKADAKDLTGTWQGILNNGKDLRMVFKMTKAAGGWQTGMFSIDEGPSARSSGLTTLHDATVKYTIPGTTAVYEGKMAGDGGAITGTWTMNGKTLPLNLKRVADAAAWEIPPMPAPMKPMAADIDPSFEVATIKPSDPEMKGRGFMSRGRSFETRNTTLSNLIEFAYGVQSKQIVDGPEWMYQDKYDLSGVPDHEGQPSSAQQKSMIKKLLAERFQLKFHTEKRELAVFALTVAKGGSKLRKNDSGGAHPSLFFRMGPGGIALPARNATMEDFAGVMQSAVLDRPVVDQTGLTGRWDFDLTWAPDDSQFSGMPLPPRPAVDNPAPGLFTALQEQVGLKLDTAKMATDVMVIDKAEKPSAN